MKVLSRNAVIVLSAVLIIGLLASLRHAVSGSSGGGAAGDVWRGRSELDFISAYGYPSRREDDADHAQSILIYCEHGPIAGDEEIRWRKRKRVIVDAITQLLGVRKERDPAFRIPDIFDRCTDYQFVVHVNSSGYITDVQSP